MASYTRGGAPNGRQNMQSSISHLNVTPSDYELMQQQQQEMFNIEEDLALFTDTQFFDWDISNNGTAHASPTTFHNGAPQQPPQPQQPQQPQQLRAFELKNDDFLSGEFSIPQYNLPTLAPQTHHSPTQQTFPPQHAVAALSPHSVGSPSSSTSFTTSKGQRIQGTASALSGKGVNGSETPGTAQHSPGATIGGDGEARVAAEEDKRRRNTAASARFRVKKKQREQALEKTAKEMTDRVSTLETRVGQLEMENKLLKDLLTEKSGKEVDVAELRRKLEEKAEDKGVKAEF